jgi:hypothetical protein
MLQNFNSIHQVVCDLLRTNGRMGFDKTNNIEVKPYHFVWWFFLTRKQQDAFNFNWTMDNPTKLLPVNHYWVLYSECRSKFVGAWGFYNRLKFCCFSSSMDWQVYSIGYIKGSHSCRPHLYFDNQGKLPIYTCSDDWKKWIMTSVARPALKCLQLITLL